MGSTVAQYFLSSSYFYRIVLISSNNNSILLTFQPTTLKMNDLISPKYIMQLVKSVNDAIVAEYHTDEEIGYYIGKWYQNNYEPSGFNNDYWENFNIVRRADKTIDITATLQSMPGMLLLQVAIDLGVDTPDFIPSIPTFRNELKTNYKTAYDTFTKAYKQIEQDPGLAIGLANSALESIIKEIMKDDRISAKLNGNETLYKLALTIIKEFKLSDDNHPKELKTIGTSLVTIGQAIETLRSEKTNFHGKTTDDYLITDGLYASLAVNAVSTVGLFLNGFYKTKYPPKAIPQEEPNDELPF